MNPITGLILNRVKVGMTIPVAPRITSASAMAGVTVIAVVMVFSLRL